MFTARKMAYAAIATGCLSVGIAVTGLINAFSETNTTMHTQPLPTANAVIETERVAISNAADGATGAERPENAAGLWAYQDEDGNFVAPPPDVAAAASPSIQRAPSTVAERQGNSPAGGFVADASGFRMSQTAHVTPEGEVAVTCDQDVEDAATHASHAEEH
jgi:hypothetical protein